MSGPRFRFVLPPAPPDHPTIDDVPDDMHDRAGWPWHPRWHPWITDRERRIVDVMATQIRTGMAPTKCDPTAPRPARDHVREDARRLLRRMTGAA